MKTPDLPNQEPQRDARTLKSARRELLQMVLTAAPPAAKATRDPARPASGPVAQPTTASAFVAKNGFPLEGRSGEAHRVPTMQFMPDNLQDTLKALGINTLADFMLRTLDGPPRELVAQMCGVPTLTLLIAAIRSELLDLPIDRQRGNQPHLKDVLLLARLGLASSEALASVGRLLHEYPSKLETLTTIVSILQKNDSTLIGRSRITKHDLQLWSKASANYPSWFTLNANTPNRDTTFHPSPYSTSRDACLLHYLNHSWASPEAIWRRVIHNATRWLRASYPGAKQSLVDAICQSESQALVKGIESIWESPDTGDTTIYTPLSQPSLLSAPIPRVQCNTPTEGPQRECLIEDETNRHEDDDSDRTFRVTLDSQSNLSTVSDAK